MSQELEPVGDLLITDFWGGPQRGRCLQLTPNTSDGYSQLTGDEVRRLRDRLSDWLDGKLAEAR